MASNTWKNELIGLVEMNVQEGVRNIFIAFISLILVHPVYPRRIKAKDDAEAMEHIAAKHPSSFHDRDGPG